MLPRISLRGFVRPWSVGHLFSFNRANPVEKAQNLCVWTGLESLRKSREELPLFGGQSVRPSVQPTNNLKRTCSPKRTCNKNCKEAASNNFHQNLKTLHFSLFLSLRKHLCLNELVSRVHATALSVGVSVARSVTLLKFLPQSYLNRINTPAHPYKTDAVVYTVLFP